MTTITRFTREQLIAKLQHRLTVAAKYPGVEEAELDAEIFKIALASLEAEPTLYAAEETLAYANMGELHLTCLSEPMGDAVIPLYTATPAPVVPEEKCDDDGNTTSEFDHGWNACRAALLQGANVSLTHEGKNHTEDKPGMVNHLGDANENGNSPVIQDGWIKCSERMPEDEQEVLTRNRMGHCFVSFFDEHSGLFFDRVDVAAACCIEHILVTHWMPLPAAPQQEAE